MSVAGGLLVVGPQGPIVAELHPFAPTPPAPPSSSASSFAENLVELLPDYIPADLDELLPDVRTGLVDAIVEIREIADDNDPAVKAARDTLSARTQLLQFLNHPDFGETQRLVANIATSLERREFEPALSLVDELADVADEVPEISGSSIFLAMWPNPMEYPFLFVHPPGDNDERPPDPSWQTGRVPGYAGPILKLTEPHYSELLAFHRLLSGGTERTFRVAVLRAEILTMLNRFREALDTYAALLGSAGVSDARKKFAAIRAGYAHLAEGDAQFRRVRSPDERRDELLAEYAAAIAVVVEHGVSADNPLRRQLEQHAAVQRAKIEGGFNVLGFKDGYVPILRAADPNANGDLYNLAQQRIDLAADAIGKFVAFRTRGNDLDDQQAQDVLDKEVSEISSRIATERRDSASTQRAITGQRQQAIVDGLWDLETTELLTRTAGFLEALGNTVSASPGTIQSILGVVSTAVGYNARRNELRDQLKLARIEAEIARRDEVIAELERESAELRTSFLADRIKTRENRFLNADLFYALSNLYEDMAERSLEEAIRWVYLLESAVAFKRLDFDLEPFNFDFRDPELGGLIAAPDNLRELVTKIGERDVPSTKFELLEENPISLRSRYPIEFARLLQTGKTDFVISLYDLEKLRSGAFHRRLVRVRVEVKGLIPETGFAGHIEHEGFFVLRDERTTLGPPAATRLLPTSKRMDEALQNLQRGNVQGDPVDGVIFHLLDSDRQELSAQAPPDDNNPERSALALFEGHGETGRWHLELDPDSIDLRLITDVLIHFRIKKPESSGELADKVEELLTAYERESGSAEDLDQIAVFSLRQQFPDAYAALSGGPGQFTLEATDFPTGITDLRVKTMVGQVVDADGSGVAGVGVEFAAVDRSFSITRTTGAGGFTEAVDEEIPFVQPPEDRVPAPGGWQVRLLDPADFARSDDVRLFLIYSFQPG